MPSPRAAPWLKTLEVSVSADVAAEVHVGLSWDFAPSADTYQGMLYGPGTFHVTGAPTGVDLYARLVAPGGEDMSSSSGPVQTTALVP
jgi:hypothetical protein